MYLRIVRDMFFSVRVITTEGSAIFLLIALLSTLVVLLVESRAVKKKSLMLLLYGQRSDPLHGRENVRDITTVRVRWLRFKCPGCYYSEPTPGR